MQSAVLQARHLMQVWAWLGTRLLTRQGIAASGPHQPRTAASPWQTHTAGLLAEA